MRIVFKTDYIQDIRPWKDTYQLMLYLILLAVVVAAPMLIDDFYLGELTNVLIWALAGMGLMILTGTRVRRAWAMRRSWPLVVTQISS